MIVIVPDSMRDAINAKLDAEFAKHPDAAVDRQIFYDYLLGYFNEQGVIPDFHLQKLDQPQTTE